MRVQIGNHEVAKEVPQLNEEQLYDYINYLEKKHLKKKGEPISMSGRFELNNRLEANASEREIAFEVLKRIKLRQKADSEIIRKNRVLEMTEG